jgi:hypothetical protein
MTTYFQSNEWYNKLKFDLDTMIEALGRVKFLLAKKSYNNNAYHVWYFNIIPPMKPIVYGGIVDLVQNFSMR